MSAAPNPAGNQTRSAGATLRVMATTVIIAQITAGTATTTIQPAGSTKRYRLCRPETSQTRHIGDVSGGKGGWCWRARTEVERRQKTRSVLHKPRNRIGDPGLGLNDRLFDVIICVSPSQCEEFSDHEQSYSDVGDRSDIHEPGFSSYRSRQMLERNNTRR